MNYDPVKILKLIKKQTAPWQIPLEQALQENNANPFQTLVSILLSSRTKDSITAKIVPGLVRSVKSPKELQKMSLPQIEKIIYPAGFYKTKAKHLKKLAGILITRFKMKIPQTQADLRQLPGIGLKTANLLLSKLYNIPAVCVDVHVHRISNRLGFVHTTTPENTEKALKKSFPEKYWSEINSILVKFGQNICFKQKPCCDICSVSSFCEYFNTQKSRN